jgi:homoserine dehydrogenase
MSSRTVRVGLLGCGHVGSALVRQIADHAVDIEARTGVRLDVTRVAVRNLARERDVPLAAAVFTHDAASVVVADDVDVVVEVIGGIEPARELIVEALKAGKPVVTANKELLANVGRELFETAEGAGVDLLFEASVAGGIPLMRPLRESLAGDRIRRVLGIVNGTTNFILSRMTESGATFSDALADAQGLGYAERDPTADVEGFDAAAKTAIIASIAFGARVVAGDVYREGIGGISDADIASASELGYAVKLLAVAEETEAGVAVRVHPTMIPMSHPLASVRDSFNALFIEADAVGQLMFYGRGAGGDPTASAVLGDVVAVARHKVVGGRGPGESTYADLPILPMGRAQTRYHISLDVADRPGVLAQVATAFAQHEVSIETVRQQLLSPDPATPEDGRASLVIVTHSAPDAALSATVDALAELPTVRAVTSVMRVEGE